MAYCPVIFVLGLSFLPVCIVLVFLALIFATFVFLVFFAIIRNRIRTLNSGFCQIMGYQDLPDNYAFLVKW
jgi:hypothetical protein